MLFLLGVLVGMIVSAVAFDWLWKICREQAKQNKIVMAKVDEVNRELDERIADNLRAIASAEAELSSARRVSLREMRA